MSKAIHKVCIINFESKHVKCNMFQNCCFPYNLHRENDIYYKVHLCFFNESNSELFSYFYSYENLLIQRVSYIQIIYVNMKIIVDYLCKLFVSKISICFYKVILNHLPNGIQEMLCFLMIVE